MSALFFQVVDPGEREVYGRPHESPIAGGRERVFLDGRVYQFTCGDEVIHVIPRRSLPGDTAKHHALLRAIRDVMQDGIEEHEEATVGLRQAVGKMETAIADEYARVGICRRDYCSRPRLSDEEECDEHHRQCRIDGCGNQRDITKSLQSPEGTTCPKHAAEAARKIAEAPR